ncbi:MAG: hypothetical protein OXF97_10875 [Nitrospira sp.]|nr:hypothetical protein [Nitrospira sp.]MCY3956102.1 hypothetical protein [Nitrospira sp.]
MSTTATANQKLSPSDLSHRWNTYFFTPEEEIEFAEDKIFAQEEIDKDPRWAGRNNPLAWPHNPFYSQSSPLSFWEVEFEEDINDCVPVTYVASSNTLEDTLRSSDLVSQYRAEFETIWTERQKTYQAYTHRIEELRRFASEDDECSDIGKSSREDFWWFVKSMPLAKRAELVLMDNGNLRAVWKGDDKTHIGLQFLGSQLGEYVIFKRRLGAKKVSRVVGIDTLEGLKKQVRAFDINIALLDKE